MSKGVRKHRIILPAVVFGVIMLPFLAASGGQATYPGYEDFFRLQSSEKQAVALQAMAQAAAGGDSIIQLSKANNVYGLAVNGRIEFEDPNGYARIILVDDRSKEFLVYETNKWLATGQTITLEETCEETAGLNAINVDHLRIESQGTTVLINDVIVSTAPPALAKSQLQQGQVHAKIDQINTTIKQKGAKWVAGETSVSRMSYAEKKQLLGGNLPNLSGFEYYIGGIFEIESEYDVPMSTPQASPYVPSFSWRNRHSQNWVSPVKSQGSCGSCWAFAATGTTELLVNIYYNQLLNLDLAEQNALSCSGQGSCSGGYPGGTLDYYKNTGAFEEECFPYTGEETTCDNKCSQPQNLIKIGGRERFDSNETEDDLKRMVIDGAVSFGISSWSHAIGLVGYKTLAEGDQIYVKTGTGDSDDGKWVDIDAGSTYVGRVAWEIKNSWGTNWGQNGFAYVIVNMENINWTHSALGPVTSSVLTDEDIRCTDNDKDGYYSWGIGEKPTSCPASPDEPDGDDSDAGYGPMTEYGYLLENITGDVNRDRILNLADLMITLKAMINETPADLFGSFDINDNSRLDLAEAIFIIKKVVE